MKIPEEIEQLYKTMFTAVHSFGRVRRHRTVCLFKVVR